MQDALVSFIRRRGDEVLAGAITALALLQIVLLDESAGVRLALAALVVTLGAEGSVVAVGVEQRRVPAFSVRAVDTTGAGDVFRAAVIYGLLERWTTEELLRFANNAAALSCTRRGAMAAVPRLADVRGAVV